MVKTVKPKARATPANPIPKVGIAAARTALPQPPKTSQNVPRNSAAARLESDTFEILLFLHFPYSPDGLRLMLPRLNVNQSNLFRQAEYAEAAGFESGRISRKRLGRAQADGGSSCGILDLNELGVAKSLHAR